MRSARWSRVYVCAAAIMALIVGLTVHGYAARAAQATARAGTRTAVVVAAASIARGSTITPGELVLSLVPRAYTQPGSLSRIDQAAGRVALTDLARGEAVTETRLARVRAGPVASLVPEGFRALAVHSSLPPGTVAAGDRVDVLAAYGGRAPHSEVVVEGVEVLKVLGPSGGSSSHSLGLPGGSGGTATALTLIVLVGPDQQERLAFASAFADLEVSIRPQEP